MKTFISDIFPKIQRYSHKLDSLTLLMNQHWVSIDVVTESKIVYIFRSNNELLVSNNGIVEKAKWEYLGNNSLLIDKKTGSYLFKHGFFDDNILALKVDSKDEYVVFVNENKYDGDLNSIDKVIDFLKNKYINHTMKEAFESSTGHILNRKKETQLRTATPEEKIAQDKASNLVLLYLCALAIIIIISIAIGRS